jgi:hypothetical protein
MYRDIHVLQKKTKQVNLYYYQQPVIPKEQGSKLFTDSLAEEHTGLKSRSHQTYQRKLLPLYQIKTHVPSF